jgi:triacylglycerol esterase/lipase EstA (alpha/beta hydrolase family)
LFDPKGSSLASRHIVLIAHSMGGLLAHTLVSDSNDELWNAVAKNPFKSLALSAHEKKVLSGFFFFRHRSCIDRVIFLAVPHYGSGLAAGIGTIGNLLIRRPKAAAEALKELAARNPGIGIVNNRRRLVGWVTRLS